MNRMATRATLSLIFASIVVLLFWMLSTAEPCLVAMLVGNSPADNPIAITECRIADDRSIRLTNGDAVVRLAALALFMVIFGLVGGLVDPARRKRSFAAIVASGAALAFGVYFTLKVAATAEASFHFLDAALLLSCVLVGIPAVAIGAAMGKSTRGDDWRSP